MTITTQDAFVQKPIIVKTKTIFGKAGNSLSRIGKSLFFPIAMLPLAAILLRVGSAIPTGADSTELSTVISKMLLIPANAIFTFLPIFFAIGVAFGLTKDSRGEAAACGFLGMVIFMTTLGSSQILGGAGADFTQVIYGKVDFGLKAATFGGTVYTSGFHTIFVNKYDAILGSNVLSGIVAGGIVAFIYNRFNGIELPKALSFFNGRRLVPVLTLIMMAMLALLWTIIFPWIGYVLFKFSGLLGDATGNHYANAGISAVYTALNRMLIPFGLHHIPNTLFWFVLGTHPAAMPTTDVPTVSGDINIFLSGAAAGNNAGTFQSGFFPIMMFGLPALVAAIWYRAEKDQRAKVIGLLGGAALISFFTGITEPIEFAFLFVAPALFFTHVVLSGLFAFITGLFGIQLGFGFSAGLVDYVLSIPKSLDIIALNKTGAAATMANPGWLFVIGGVCAVTYFFTGSYLIRRFNWATPGRGINRIEAAANEKAGQGTMATGKWAEMADKITVAVGGMENIEILESCTTRLRMVLKDRSKADDAAVRAAGALGIMKVGTQGYQVVIGTSVEQVANIMTARRSQTVKKTIPAT